MLTEEQILKVYFLFFFSGKVKNESNFCIPSIYYEDLFYDKNKEPRSPELKSKHMPMNLVGRQRSCSICVW